MSFVNIDIIIFHKKGFLRIWGKISKHLYFKQYKKNYEQPIFNVNGSIFFFHVVKITRMKKCEVILKTLKWIILRFKFMEYLFRIFTCITRAWENIGGRCLLSINIIPASFVICHFRVCLKMWYYFASGVKNYFFFKSCRYLHFAF